MSKRTEAIRWELLGKDGTGAMIDIDWNCPYCNENNGGLVFFGEKGAELVDSPFETDQQCDWCGKMVIVECR